MAIHVFLETRFQGSEELRPLFRRQVLFGAVHDPRSTRKPVNLGAEGRIDPKCSACMKEFLQDYSITRFHWSARIAPGPEVASQVAVKGASAHPGEIVRDEQ
jgi:hypothetical protein